MERWKGTNAIVTGASSGIGAAISTQLVRHGINVVGIARRSEVVEEIAKTLQNEAGKLFAIKADVGNEEDVYRSFKWIKENVGNIHILVNNAGMAVVGTLINGEPRDWKRTLDVNLIGATLCAKLAIQNMLENKIDGQVININSTSGHFVYNIGKINMYPVSKFGMTAMGSVLRRELAFMDSKIKVSSISPGVVDTDIAKTYFTKTNQDQLWKSLVKLNSEDIADTVEFILNMPPHVLITEVMMHHVEQHI